MATDRMRALQVDDTEVVTQVIGARALLPAAADASTLEVNSTTGKMRIKPQGTSLANGVQRASVSKFAGTWIQGTLVASDAAAGVFSETNSYGSALAIIRVIVDATTAATGACTINIGQGSGSGTSYDNVIDGLDVGTAAKMADNLGDPGTNGNSVQKWLAGEYLNASMASGAASGLVGTYAICVVDLN
jgi:hypothetical protein